MAEMPAVSDGGLPERMRISAPGHFAITPFCPQRLLDTFDEVVASHGQVLRPTSVSPLEVSP